MVWNMRIYIILGMLITGGTLLSQENVTENKWCLNSVHTSQALINQLGKAIKKDDAEYVKRIIDTKQIDINEIYINGDKLLHYATRFDSVRSAAVLIREKIDINARNDMQDTPLHIAAYNNSEQIANALLRSGADIQIKNAIHETPLQIARLNGNLAVAQVLIDGELLRDTQHLYELSNSELENYMYCNSLHYAKLALSQCNYQLAQEILLNYGYSVADAGEVLLHALILQSLHGRENGLEILIMAMSNEYTVHSMLSILGQEFICSNIIPDSIIQFVLDKFPEQVIRFRDEDGNTFIHYMVQYHGWRQEDIITALINNGLYIDAINNKGETPLHISALYGDSRLCQFLISCGSDVSIENNMGKTPIEIADSSEALLQMLECI